MSLGFMVGVLRARRALRGHERWTRARLDAHRGAAPLGKAPLIKAFRER